MNSLLLPNFHRITNALVAGFAFFTALAPAGILVTGLKLKTTSQIAELIERANNIRTVSVGITCIWRYKKTVTSPGLTNLILRAHYSLASINGFPGIQHDKKTSPHPTDFTIITNHSLAGIRAHLNLVTGLSPTDLTLRTSHTGT
jgi:hypothetical protein